ncbi:MAG: hypothetical protein JWP48_1199, partial [Actinoallomurus sp.]|nr:hypothetical protein [Actinoallomurus sp.]
MGLSGRVPLRVDAVTKEALLDLIEHALWQGWTVHQACRVLELNRVRAYRWLERRQARSLEDAKPGGNPVHGLLDEEITEVRPQRAHVHRVVTVVRGGQRVQQGVAR